MPLKHSLCDWLSTYLYADRRHRKWRKPRSAENYRPGRQTESSTGGQDLAKNVSADVYSLQHRLLADVHAATGRDQLSGVHMWRPLSEWGMRQLFSNDDLRRISNVTVLAIQGGPTNKRYQLSFLLVLFKRCTKFQQFWCTAHKQWFITNTVVLISCHSKFLHPKMTSDLIFQMHYRSKLVMGHGS